MTATSDIHDRFVLFRDGPSVPAPAYVLLLDLETRGFTVRRDRDTLVVTPPARLTPTDCAAIRQWKRHLLVLLAYGERSDLDAHLFDDRKPASAERQPTQRKLA